MNQSLLKTASEVVSKLNPKHYMTYFRNFYIKHGFLKTAVLIYMVLCLLYMVLKHYGLWFKKDVKNKHVFITGAGSGIGRQMAKMLAKLRCKVTVSDINFDAAKKTAKMIENTAGKVVAVKLDVTSIEDIHNAHETAKAKFGKVDILINNAGIVSGKYVDELSKQNIDSTFMVNTISHFYMVKEFLPSMLENNDGHIVTISSASCTVGVPKMTDYVASKFAAFGFDESLRVELKKRGTNIKTTCICPFYINTGMFEGAKTRISFLLPIVEEEWAAKRIIHAILQEEQAVFMPFIVNFNFLTRAILPVSWFDAFQNLIGTRSSMDDFKGRS